MKVKACIRHNGKGVKENPRLTKRRCVFVKVSKGKLGKEQYIGNSKFANVSVREEQGSRLSVKTAKTGKRNKQGKDTRKRKPTCNKA